MKRFRHSPNPRADARCWLLAAGLLVGCTGPVDVVPVSDGRFVMGTVLELTLLVRPGQEESARAALEAAFDSVSNLERLVSRFLESSDVGRLNARAGLGDVEIDAQVYRLLQQAEEARRTTHSAFDVSVGPLVDLWRRAAERDVAPGAIEIAMAASLVGRPVAHGAFARGHWARLDEAGMSVDLGGIAKGFALDGIASQLRLAGFPRGLLSFGQSSVWALGSPRDGPAWRLALQDDEGQPLGVIEICNQALSVSSSFGKWSSIDGRRYGHVVDPRTGLAVAEARRAVVVAGEATLAEALSTALLVLSEPEARAVLEDQRAEAWVFRSDGSSWQTQGWPGEGCATEPVRAAFRADLPGAASRW